jgi:uncharacterized lipoprotein YajG
MDSNFTAQMCRTKATAVLGEKVKLQLQKCQTLIEAAVRENKMSANVFITLDNLTQQELTSRGFVVKLNQGDPRDPREQDYHTISW